MSIEGDIDEVISALTATADAQDATHLQNTLATLGRSWSNPKVRVGFFGEVSRGKSSVVNALIGSQKLAVGGGPVTSAWTEVEYSPEPSAIALIVSSGNVGRHVSISISEPGLFGAIQAGEISRLNDFQRAKGDRLVGLSLGLPSSFLGRGFILTDTPGVGGLRASHRRAAMTRLGKVDAFVFAIKPDKPISIDEMHFLGSALLKCRTCIIVQTHSDIVDLPEHYLKQTLAELTDPDSWSAVEELRASAQDLAAICAKHVSGVCVELPTDERFVIGDSGVEQLKGILNAEVLNRRARIQAQNTITLLRQLCDDLLESTRRKISVLSDDKSAQDERARLEKMIKQWEAVDGDLWKMHFQAELEKGAERLLIKGAEEIRLVRSSQTKQLSKLSADQIESEMKALSADVPTAMLDDLLKAGGTSMGAALDDLQIAVKESGLGAAFSRLEELDTASKLSGLSVEEFQGVAGESDRLSDHAAVAARGTAYSFGVWGSLKGFAGSLRGKQFKDSISSTALGSAVVAAVTTVSSTVWVPAAIVGGGALLWLNYESGRKERVRSRGRAERYVDSVCQWMNSSVVEMAVDEYRKACAILVEDVEATLEEEAANIREARETLRVTTNLSPSEVEAQLRLLREGERELIHIQHQIDQIGVEW